MIVLLLMSCDTPCEGIGCQSDFSASLVDIITGLDDLNTAPTSPRDALLTIEGELREGPDWDFALSDEHLFVGSPATGSVHGFLTRIDDTVATGIVKTTSAQSTVNGLASESFGAQVALLSDSTSTLIVGAPTRAGWESRHQGAVYLFDGLTETLNTNHNASQAQLRIDGPGPESQFGKVIVSCPDMDGDGLNEWIASAPTDSTGSTLSGFIAVGLSSSRPQTDSIQALAILPHWFGSSIGERAGSAMSCSHDLTPDNGRDGPDILIGAPFADPSQTTDAGGAIYVMSDAFSMSGPLFLTANHILYGESDNDWLGWSVATGDLNNDGFVDIVGGAPGAQGTGEILIWDGAAFASGSTTPQYRISGAEQGDGFGTTVKLADLNGDGLIDLVSGAPKHNPTNNGDESAYNSGAIYIFYNGKDRDWEQTQSTQDADLVLSEGAQYLYTGQMFEVGDYTGDDLPELIILHRNRP